MTKRTVNELTPGDVIRLPKIGFQIINIIPVESQSNHSIIEIAVRGVNDPFRGVRGNFLITSTDKVDVITRNNIFTRIYYWFKRTKEPVPIVHSHRRPEVPYNPFLR